MLDMVQDIPGFQGKICCSHFKYGKHVKMANYITQILLYFQRFLCTRKVGNFFEVFI